MSYYTIRFSWEALSEQDEWRKFDLLLNAMKYPCSYPQIHNHVSWEKIPKGFVIAILWLWKRGAGWISKSRLQPWSLIYVALPCFPFWEWPRSAWYLGWKKFHIISWCRLLLFSLLKRHFLLGWERFNFTSNSDFLLVSPPFSAM